MISDPIDVADLHLRRGNAKLAVASIQTAALAGDARALFQLAYWLVIGSLLPRDLPRARSLLRRAAELGHTDAISLNMVFAANGTGAPADWAEAAMHLRQLVLLDDPAAMRLQQLLADMKLGDDGAPATLPTARALTEDGMITKVERFLSDAECSYIIGKADGLMQPAMVSDPSTGRNVPHPVRTSDTGLLGPLQEDPAVRAINRRIAAITGTPVDAGETLTILRYKVGQEFRIHHDCLPVTRNQRALTVLIYLNDGFSGGETHFPDYGLTVRPRRGDALVFRNTDQQGRPWAKMRHAGAPVTEGIKWLVTRWIRKRSFNVWTGPET